MSDHSKMWTGRFNASIDPLMERFSRSIAFDVRLFAYDIRLNQAWAGALREAGVLSSEEQTQVVCELERIKDEFAAGKLRVEDCDEDVHMFVERLLTERLGDVGKQIHYGKSRNDQVATDVRLFLRDSLREMSAAVSGLQSVVVQRAEAELGTVLPGYTHLQQAQPVLLSHYLMSLFHPLERGRERIREIAERQNVMPLGAAAFAGTTLKVDLAKLATELGFSAPAENSIDAVSEREFVIEVLQICSQIMVVLSRYAEDWIIWCSQEFKFLEPNDRFATGSSIMPQKKNPDSLELIRGKTARVIANEMSLLSLTKGLPLTYNRDLQEDKVPLFDSIDTVKDSLGVMTGFLTTVKFSREQMRKRIGGNSLATDLADYLVTKGVPFRKAHEIVGKTVAYAEKKGLEITELSADELMKIDERLGSEALTCLSISHCISARNAHGGTSQESINRQLKKAKYALSKS